MHTKCNDKIKSRSLSTALNHTLHLTKSKDQAKITLSLARVANLW